MTVWSTYDSYQVITDLLEPFWFRHSSIFIHIHTSEPKSEEQINQCWKSCVSSDAQLSLVSNNQHDSICLVWWAALIFKRLISHSGMLLKQKSDPRMPKTFVRAAPLEFFVLSFLFGLVPSQHPHTHAHTNTHIVAALAGDCRWTRPNRQASWELVSLKGTWR